MSNVTYFVGLDYHQQSVQVCVMNSDGFIIQNISRRNDWREVAEVVPKDGRVFAAIEACNGAASFAEELIARAGWSVDLAHPGYVARIKQSPDKSDWADARLLADLERVGYLPKVWLAPEATRELRRLVRFRQQLVNQSRDIKLRIHAGETSRWILCQHFVEIDRLTAMIRDVEKRLEEMTSDDAVVCRLLEQSGVGLVTAVTLRAEIGRFDRFRSGKQLARFCAVTPRNASSGQRQADAGMIKAGNRELRRVLIQAALRLKRLDDHWVAFAERLKDRGKPANVITVAVANRWVRGLYYTMCELAA